MADNVWVERFKNAGILGAVIIIAQILLILFLGYELTIDPVLLLQDYVRVIIVGVIIFTIYDFFFKKKKQSGQK